MFSSARETYNFFGNENIEKFMLKSINSRKLHHAYLFTGAKGLGKATFAYRVSKYILSNSLQDNMNVDRSEKVDKLIRKNSHPDFMVLSKDIDNEKSVIEINQVRECISFFNHTPILGRYKICIIDSLDDMNTNGANALLKILEEPQENSIFFIISHCKETVLPTIKSRCLNLRFNKFSNTEIKGFLENNAIDGIYDLNEIIELSNGSIGRAIDLVNEDAQEIIFNVKNLFAQSYNEDIYKLENFLRKSSNIDLFFELSISMIDKLIKEFVLSKVNQENEKVHELFSMRADIQKIYHEGKKYKNLKTHMILDLILLIKKSYYH